MDVRRVARPTMTTPARPTVWFNGACSTCRRLRVLLEERGVDAEYRHYLDDPPSAEEIARVLRLMGDAPPGELVRWKDALVGELGLAEAAPEALVAALARHPRLIERPVVVAGERALVARPPQRALELMGAAPA